MKLSTIVKSLAAVALIAGCSKAPDKPRTLELTGQELMEERIADVLLDNRDNSSLLDMKPAASTNFSDGGIDYLLQFYDGPSNKCTAVLYHDHNGQTNVPVLYTQVISTNAFDAGPLTNDAYIFKSTTELAAGTHLPWRVDLFTMPSGTLNSSYVLVDGTNDARVIEVWRTNGASIKTYTTNLNSSPEIYLFIIPNKPEQPRRNLRDRSLIL